MAKKKPLALMMPLTFFMLMSFAAVKPAAKTFDGRFYDSSLPMDFTDSTESEIQTYYASLDNSSTGQDFMKELYTVISKDNHFIDYGSGASSGVNQWYKITDRNWALSRAIDPKTYKFSDDTKDNYYLNLLYFQDNTTKDKAINSYVNGFKVDKSITKVDFENKLRPNNYIQEDKEHIWAKSHGFAPEGDPAPGAGTDLHHLLAADHMTNNLHNNNYYGIIDKKQKYTEVYCYYADGTKDVSGWVGLDKNGMTTFEPTDQYKGDVARALLYMGVRYSNKLDKNTREEPYLLLTDNITQKDDNANFHGVHQHLSDFLAWNELDPVSDYEIHRNNLIYKNVQNNRNPFIDHPEWARRVYDPSNYSSASNFTKLKPSYNVHIGSSFTLPIDFVSTSTITLEYDNNFLKVDSDNKTITPLKESKEGTVLKYHEIDSKGNKIDKEVKFIIWDKPSVDSSSVPNEIRLAPLLSKNIDIKANNVFPDEKITLVSKDSSIVSTDGTTIKGLRNGSTTVDIVVEGNQKETIGTIDVSVSFSTYFDPEYRTWTIIVIVAIVLVLVISIIIIVYFLKKKNRRKRRRRRK